MKRTYTREFRKLVEAEIQSGASSTSLCKKYSLPYGTVARWKWTLKLNAEPKKVKSKPADHSKTASRPTDKEILDLLNMGTELLLKSTLRELQMRIRIKRYILISYLLGTLIGMAIGSMIVNYFI